MESLEDIASSLQKPRLTDFRIESPSGEESVEYNRTPGRKEVSLIWDNIGRSFMRKVHLR
jgi:hypothetical protein